MLTTANFNLKQKMKSIHLLAFLFLYLNIFQAYSINHETPKRTRIRNLMELSKQLQLSSSSSSTFRFTKRINRLKIIVRQEINRKINICFKRFQQCSQKLSPSICSSPGSMTFYVWARKMAKAIMNGLGDENNEMVCYPEIIRQMVATVKSNVIQEKMFVLWLNSNSK